MKKKQLKRENKKLHKMLNVEMKENNKLLANNYKILEDNCRLLRKIAKKPSIKSDRYTPPPQTPHAMETLQEIIAPFDARTKKEENESRPKISRRG